MTLNPGHRFAIVRQLNNPYITDTFYVRAVIRNAYTDAILDTINLTDKTGQRFKGDWQVPQDPSGQGFYISIVTSVYTDSGYTTKSDVYGDEENTYLVQDRVQRFGGTGGVDAFTIRKIVQEEVGKLTVPQSDERQERWEDILAAIRAIDIPTPEKTDLSPVLKGLKSLEKNIATAIEQKPVTPATDLSPVLERLKDEKLTDKQVRIHIEGLKYHLEQAIKKAIPAPVKEPTPSPSPYSLKKYAR